MATEMKRLCNRCNAVKVDNKPCPSCGSPEYRLQQDIVDALRDYRAIEFQHGTGFWEPSIITVQYRAGADSPFGDTDKAVWELTGKMFPISVFVGDGGEVVVSFA